MCDIILYLCHRWLLFAVESMSIFDIIKTSSRKGNCIKSECSVKLLNNPYGQASFDSFRLKNRAFADS